MLASLLLCCAAGPDFVKDVRPLLHAKCVACHGPAMQKGGLRLDGKTAAFKGGDFHAPALVPGSSAKSPLFQFVAGGGELEMPPDGPRLAAGEVAILKAWIDAGAVWPDGVDDVKLRDPLDHWSFQPVRRPAPPQVADAAWVWTPVDAFVLAKLEAKGLRPSSDAARQPWLRRVSFTLIGLPPTPAEVEAFLADQTPDAHAKVVDRLLASPRYGERWARHWLDAVAFGETSGFEVNTPRPNAWPYRDYVIAALNEDRPYPQFIKEQLAGDAAGADAGTGFLVAGPANLTVGKDEASIRAARQDELNGMAMAASGVFLGLTASCARCHDHKFDPISQRDYHALQAAFAGVKHGERPLPNTLSPAEAAEAARLRPRRAELDRELAAFEPLAEPAAKAPRRAAVHPRGNSERFAPIVAARIRFTVLRTNSAEPCLDELEAFADEPQPRNVALAAAGAKASSSGDYQDPTKHKLAHLHDGKYGNGRSWISNQPGRGWVEIAFAKPETISRIRWARDREGQYRDRLPTEYRIEAAGPDGQWRTVAGSNDRAPFKPGQPSQELPEPAALPAAQREKFLALRGERERVAARLAALEPTRMAYAGRFVPAEPVRRLHRGDAMQPRETVAPGSPARLPAKYTLPENAPEQQRRLALAAWLADPANPLPARVMANRVWQHHFGVGIVDTPSDFGNNGARPTHPELLDWLAAEFVAQGWSLKKLHRLLCLSHVYRQASVPNPAGLATDAETRLLWRFPPRRLEAEPLRDAILATAGTLDLRMGGPGYSPFAPNENYVRVYDPKPAFGPAEWRRMVYQTKVRMAQDFTFGVFDCPDAGLPQPKRARSNTPLQALALFNSGFVLQQAEKFAERLRREAGADPARQAEHAFRLALGRAPDAEETALALPLIRDAGLPNFCRVVLNLNEFLFVP